MPERTTILLVLSMALVAVFSQAAARADYISLKSGGEIRGELFSSHKDAAKIEAILIRALSGAVVSVARDEISAVVRRRPIVEEYETRRRAAPRTIAGQWETAEWCRQKSLSLERRFHLGQVLALDPEHEAAHRGLGHIRDQGRWTTRDEILESRGYVQHKGKRVLPQELDLTLQQDRLRQTERNWFKRIKQWQVWLDSDRDDRQSAAIKALNAIRESEAIPALVSSFRNAPEEDQRLLLVRVLSKIEGDGPIAALVLQSILDDSRAVRHAAIGAVRQKNAAKAVPMYLKSLKSRLNAAVNRAATALGQLADESAIPYLIDALITRHGYYVAPNSDGQSSGTGQEAGDDLVVIASSDTVKSSIGNSTAVTPARGPTADEPDDETVHVEMAQENPDVLAALNLLTNQNFGYHADSWKSWYHARQQGSGKKRAPKALPVPD
jgi:hypothetical protein